MLHLLLAAASAASPPADDPMKPLGKWNVDWGQTNCLAIQRYGDAAKPITFAFRPSIDGSAMRLMISRRGIHQRATHLEVRVGNVRTTALAFTPTGSRMQGYWINIARAEFDRLAKEPGLAIDGERLHLDFSTRGFAAATKALDECAADLRKRWNADEAGEARIGSRAAPLIPPEKLLKPEDYPGQAIFEQRSGATGISLLIDEVGAIKDCVVEEASGVATLDAQTCILVTQRGRFSAAKDAAGNPVKSRLLYRFRWQLG